MSDRAHLPQEITKATLLEQSKGQLHAFFQNKYVKKLVPVLVPGVLAAALFPFFGPVAAGTVGAIAIKNTLALLHIDMSADTIEKLLKPIEGKKLEDDDLQEILSDTLEDLLPQDKKVNEETARALVTLASTIKEEALNNPKLDADWLGASLEESLKMQGEMMEKIASAIHTLILKDPQALEDGVQNLLQNWSRIAVEIIATNESKVSRVTSKARAEGGQIGHRVVADGKSLIEDIDMDSEIS